MKPITYFILTALIIVQTSVKTEAQEETNYPKVNEQSYAYYLSGDWENLIKTGKEAKTAGIDFYYLKVRMGIAY